jgi:signal transduction histidine kinase
LRINISSDKLAIITIEDNGGGIKEEILHKVFDPYFTTKHKSQGTGIGLYMSYDIIVNHMGGKLYATNTQQGAKFFIELNLK